MNSWTAACLQAKCWLLFRFALFRKGVSDMHSAASRLDALQSLKFAEEVVLQDVKNG